jgi:tripartite motif-containing protein 71
MVLVMAATAWGPGGTAQAGPPPDPDAIEGNIVPPAYEWTQSSGGPQIRLHDPAGLVMGGDNTVLISDCAADRIQVYDLQGNHKNSLQGEPGDSESKLRCPRGIALDGPERLLVVDSGNDRVVALRVADGQFMGEVVPRGSGLITPYDVASNGSHIAVTDPGAEAVHFFGRQEGQQRTCGSSGEAPEQWANPLGAAFDDQGTLFVADQQNHRIKALTPTCDVVANIGTYGSQPGELVEPSDVDYRDGRLYIADLTNHRIQVFSTLGGYLYQWGRHPNRPHEGAGRTHYPQFISANPSNSITAVCEPFELRCQLFDRAFVEETVVPITDSAFWRKYQRFHYGTVTRSLPVRPIAAPEDFDDGFAILEPDISKVVVMTWSGEHPKIYSEFGGFGSDPGQFKQPTGVAVHPDTAELYVSDGHNHRIQVFTLKGEYIRSFGQYGSRPGDMRGPAGLAFDEEGRLWVAQAHGDRIDIFDTDGRLIKTVGSTGSGPLQFSLPLGLTFDQDRGRMYVSDTYNSRVQVLDADGGFLFAFGEHGAGAGQFINSIATEVDTAGNVYLTDTATDRVLKFTGDGQFVKAWGQFGSDIGQFYKPKGLTVLGDRLLVIDFGNHRGQAFTLDGAALGTFGEDVFHPAVDMPGEESGAQWWPTVSLILATLLGVALLIIALIRRSTRQTRQQPGTEPVEAREKEPAPQ